MKVQIFKFLSALMKVHPIPHASFETTRSRFTQILHLYSLYFLSQTLILWTKRAHRSEIFRLLSGLFTKFLVMFETTSQFFFKLFITLQCHEKLFCTFLAETVHDFDKRSASKCKISQTFHCSCKISLNLYFHRLLLFKVYKISAKKVQRSYVS